MIIKVNFSLNIGLIGRQEDTIEIEVEDNFYELPEDVRDAILEYEWKEWAGNYIDGNIKIVE
ncbi:DUF7167 family protein [Hymenobacter glacieicola]|uniref:DUF7167 domain-containing protein n=1 Tax=Hymenobacter glacieicola TaxID=1562124 RepID=A0ABQ1X5M6_9BACT|nr:hypothetical protein [Hymenobacter glacieicola]GGG61074.1 hypothetical protein GCM10011378_41360 [Hymenobacter glacieicola]